MCQMRIILKNQDGGCEVVLENAGLLTVTPEGIQVSALFGQPQLIRDAEVAGMDFLESTITLVRTGRKHPHGTENRN